MALGSLSSVMQRLREALSEDQISYVLRQTLLGLSYLHDKRKVHRDIKAGNLLLNDSCEVWR